MPQLIISRNNQIVRRIKLTKSSYSIGRSSECDIVLQERTISNYHAKILNTGKECFLEDTNSTNGIFVNHYTTKKHLLIDNDVIQIATYQLTFRSAFDLAAQLKQLSIQPGVLEKPQSPWLEILNGDEQGNIILLEREQITLSDHENDKITIQRNADGSYSLHKITVQDTKKINPLMDQDSFRVGDADLIFHMATTKESTTVRA